MATSRRGQSLLLASIMALFSYVPFEYVAKFSLVLAILLFVFDPVPPLSRMLSLSTLFVVAVLAKEYNKWQAQKVEGEEKQPTTISASGKVKPKKEE
jgi:hypothetical protein